MNTIIPQIFRKFSCVELQCGPQSSHVPRQEGFTCRVLGLKTAGLHRQKVSLKIPCALFVITRIQHASGLARGECDDLLASNAIRARSSCNVCMLGIIRVEQGASEQHLLNSKRTTVLLFKGVNTLLNLECCKTVALARSRVDGCAQPHR